MDTYPKKVSQYPQINNSGEIKPHKQKQRKHLVRKKDRWMERNQADKESKKRK